MDQLPEDARRIATERVKWSRRYQAKYGIRSGEAKNLPEGKAEEIQHLAKRVYRALGLSGYARIDVRMDAEGQRVRAGSQSESPNRARRRFCGFGRASRLYLSRAVAGTAEHRTSLAASQSGVAATSRHILGYFIRMSGCRTLAGPRQSACADFTWADANFGASGRGAKEALGAEAETKQQGYTRVVFLRKRWSEVDVVEIDDQCRRQGEIVDSLVLQ